MLKRLLNFGFPIIGIVTISLVIIPACSKQTKSNDKVFNLWKDLMTRTGQAYYAADLKQALLLADSALVLTQNVDDVLYSKTLNRKATVLIKLQRVDEAEKTSMLSLQEAEKTGDVEAISDALNAIGNFYANKGDVVNAEVYYKKVLELSEKINDGLGTGNALNNLATCMEIGGYYPEALQYYNRALKVYEDLDSSSMVGMVYSNMAAVYYQQKENKSAIKFQIKANAIHKTINNQHGLIYGMSNLGSYYNADNVPDSATICHLASLELAGGENTDNPRYLFSGYSGLCESYLAKEDFANAIKYGKMAMDVIDTLDLPYDKAGIQMIYAKALYQNGQFADAYLLLSKAKMAMDTLQTPDLKLAMLDTYKGISENEGDFKAAFNYQKQWQVVKDSVLSSERVAAIERENTRFKVYEKDKMINAQMITNVKQQRWITLLSMFGIGVLLLAGLFYYRSQSMKNRSRFLENEKLLLEEMNERLNSDNKELLDRMEVLGSQKSLTQEQINKIRDEPIIFSTKNRMSVPLKCNEIKYIEQVGDYSWVVPQEYEKRFQVRGSLKAMEEFLSNFRCFVKVQQSFIVNLDHVVEANRSRLRLVNDQINQNGKMENKEVEINLGRDYQERFLQSLNDWKVFALQP